MSARLIGVVITLFKLTALTPANADEVTLPISGGAPASIHKLVIAAKNTTVISETRADVLINAMNELIQGADPSCSGITFIRDRPIHYNNNLPQIGTVADIANSLDTSEPTANVLVVITMNYCAGKIMVAGCAPVGKRHDSMLVQDVTVKRGPVVWVHERGHVKDLGHVAEGQEENVASPSDRDNLMYWKALVSGHLLIPFQCSAYTNTAVISTDGGSLAATVTLGQSAPSSNYLEPQAAPAADTGDSIPPALTKAASDVLYRQSWVHGMPLPSVKELNNEDVNSIAESFNIEKPLPVWQEMLGVLAYKKNEKFLSIAQDVLSRPDINIPDLGASQTQEDETKFEERSEEARSLIRAKVFIPTALGIYTYETQDVKAASFLGSLADRVTSQNIVGGDLADAVSEAAVSGLAIAAAKNANDKQNNIGALSQKLLRAENGEKATVFSGMQFEFKDTDVQDRVAKAAPSTPVTVSPNSLERANTVFDVVREKGLDGFIVNGTGEQ